MSAAARSTRSLTGHHNLLPSSNRDISLPDHVVINILPKNSFVQWTLNRGVVIWRIWPAVLLHTTFAAGTSGLCRRIWALTCSIAVVTITEETKYSLGIPNVLITVLGVVIGFVISYRASSGWVCVLCPKRRAARSGMFVCYMHTIRILSRVSVIHSLTFILTGMTAIGQGEPFGQKCFETPVQSRV